MESLRLWLSALTTPFIAGLGLWIAYRQYHLQRYRFRYDISERRLAIFSAVRELLSEVVGIPRHPPNNEAWAKFTLQTAGAAFLFKADVVSFLDRLRASYLNLAWVSDIKNDEGISPREKIELGREGRAEREKLLEQLKEVETVFLPYLDLRDAGRFQESRVRRLFRDIRRIPHE